MNSFSRIFGSGPIGLFISLVLLLFAFYLKNILHPPQIMSSKTYIPILLFIIFTIVTIIIIIWSLVSLNPKERGRILITSGALKYFRHPLYAAFLSFFNFGLVFLLNNWIFVIWAILLHPAWHFLVKFEEKELVKMFSGDYIKYCKNTGRFFPRLFYKKR